MTIPGIRSSYPRLPLSPRRRAWLAATRPFTLLAPVLGVLLTAAAAVRLGYAPWPDATRLVFGILALGLATAGGNLVNQATDAAEDRINRPYRPVANGVLRRDDAWLWGVIAWIIGLGCAAGLGAAMFLLTLAACTVSFAYSVPPLRLKRLPWMGNLGVALARGIIGYAAAWSVTAPLTTVPVTYGIIVSVFLVGATTAKDFADAPGDDASGVRTLPVTYGSITAALVSLPFVLSPILLLPIFASGMHLELAWYGLTSLACCLLAWTMIRHPLAQNASLEGTRAWAYMYLCLLLLLAGPAI